jgi:putative ubiquitin-RnfH superfamily antitoxin RatB of RatAB toxin-antitoxin module
MAEPPGMLSVEVVWIGSEPPLRLALQVPTGSTVADALADRDVAARIESARRTPAGQGPYDGLAVAVFGRLAALHDRLHEHDRIELLPPLSVDPKVARQRRAEHRRRASGERRWAPDREQPKAPRPD